MKVIKRYANRRLYDSETSKTITLEEVADFIQSGHEVRIIDNISGEDITTKILGQTFLKLHEGQNNQPLVNFILTALIRESQAGFLNFIKKLAYAGIGISQMSVPERDSFVKALLKIEDVQENNKDVFLNLSERGRAEALKFKDNLLSSIETISSEIENSLSFVFSHFDRGKKLNELSEKIDQISKAVDAWNSRQKGEK